ncbi:MAG TPA: GGDEF domain-containing protein [Vicinamibacterales bacterium]|nr:GGDEF domain-containing protein [Vicinamibacterales bacterium]
MSDPRLPGGYDPEVEAHFRESRVNSLIHVNMNTFWSIAIILLAFGVWDAFVDAANWRSAFLVRVAGAMTVIATGLFQKMPGKGAWLPTLAKFRLITAVISSVIAASMLDEGYVYGVAGLVVIILTGPYIAIDSRDLLKTNVLLIALLMPVVFAVAPTQFDMIGTGVFVLLAIAVSTLLGRVLESSHRRAFSLELEQHRDARTDALTGLANRRAIQERGRVELKLAKRTTVPVSVVLCDLDHFKNINDRYGHETGDAALVKVAAVLKAALRETDALGRWGGEEFIAVLPATTAPGAREVAERMRAAIESISFPGLAERTTMSIGVATSQEINDPVDEWDLLIKEADRRLYRAKHDGRNQVVSD